MRVGGEDRLLRLSNKQKKQEIKDWNMYSFVPGYVYEGDDNPLTLHNRDQYRFRMQRTKPDPRMFVPRPWNGVAPTTMMQNVYVRDQPFFDANNKNQYRGSGVESYPYRRSASDMLTFGDKMNTYPDGQQMAFPNGNRGETINVTRALMLASKSLM
jgi:hypothetical protein